MIPNQFKQSQQHHDLNEFIDEKQIKQLETEEEKMAKLNEAALNYETPKTKNIADLDKVPVELELEDGEGKDSEGKVFRYKFIVVDGESYRVPGSVLGGLKAVLTKKPDLKFFSVSRQGEGMNTRYIVVPMD